VFANRGGRHRRRPHQGPDSTTGERSAAAAPVELAWDEGSFAVQAGVPGCGQDPRVSSEHPGTAAVEHTHGHAVAYAWRGQAGHSVLDAVHAEGFGHQEPAHDRGPQPEGHGLGWVTVVCGTEPVGFVDVAWAAGVHAFLLDTVVSAAHQRRGIGAALVHAALDGARTGGSTWVHVDFEERLRGFYLRSGRLDPTDAGSVALHEPVGASHLEANRGHGR
jgi:GNAT superfamily N-acetyltransferase